MFKKINLGSSLAALIIFAFPWVDVQCSGKTIATQSGLQVIYGGASPSAEMEALGGESSADDSSESESDKSMGGAPLVGLALVAVVGALLFSIMGVFRGPGKFENGPAIMLAIALILLVSQLMIGFPAKTGMMESMAGSNPEAPTDDEMGAEMGESMAKAMMMNFQVKASNAFYLELVVLGIPTLFLLNGVIDRKKKVLPVEEQETLLG